MDSKFLNWSNSDGSPYRIPNIEFHDGQFNWKILSSHERDKYESLKEKEQAIISFPCDYKIYQITKLSDIGTLNLLGGFYKEVYEDGTTENLWVDDFDDYPHFFLKDNSKPVYVYASYPFGKAVEIEIKPYSFTRVIENKENYLVKNRFGVGYILWQISKAYEDIYKNHWEKVGVWGHEIMDLSFYSIKFVEDNIAFLGIES